MPTTALILVLVAGVIHATWNIAAKKIGGDSRFALLTSVMLALFWAPLGVPLSVRQVPAWTAEAWVAILISGLLHVGYYLILLRGYRLADLTVVYPLARGSGPLLTSIVAVLFLGETLSALAGFGISAVVLGVFLIAGGLGLVRAARDPARSERVRAGLFYGGVTGVFIAGYTVVDGWAVKHLGLSPILVDYVGNLVRILILIPIVLPQRATLPALWARQWRGALFIAAVSPVAYVLVMYAMQMAPLSHVAPAREISMLFAAIIGGKLLSEGDRGPRIAGAALIACGVMALGIG